MQYGEWDFGDYEGVAIWISCGTLGDGRGMDGWMDGWYLKLTGCVKLDLVMTSFVCDGVVRCMHIHNSLDPSLSGPLGERISLGLSTIYGRILMSSICMFQR